MSPTPLDRLRRLCMALPDAREVEAWGSPTFRVKTMFATYSDGRYAGGGRESAWIKSDPTNQGLLVRRSPERYFVPPYVGPKGWIGAFIDGDAVDWDEIQDLLWEAWTQSVPARLAAAHPEPPEGW